MSFILYYLFFRDSTSDSKEKDGVKTLAKTLANLSSSFEWIKVKGSGRARDYDSSSLSNYKVELNPDTNDSWLADPEPGKGDSIGAWPASCDFPTALANIVPGDRKESLSTPIPHFYHTDNLENFFNAKSLINSSKIKLNDKAFDPPTMTAPAKENAHVIDSLLRSALSENAICDKFIMSLSDKVKEWEDPTNDDDMSSDEKFKILSDSLKLASIASLRSKQYTVAAFANNKISFRQRVLDKCNGPKVSKDILKNTSLASPFLFGDIPESLVKRYDISLTSRDSYMIKPMAQSGKRTSSPSASNHPKKARSLRTEQSRPQSSHTPTPYERNLGKDNFPLPPRAHHHSKSQGARHRGGKGGRK